MNACRLRPGSRGYRSEAFDDFEFENLRVPQNNRNQADNVQELAAVLVKQFGHADATC